MLLYQGGALKGGAREIFPYILPVGAGQLAVGRGFIPRRNTGNYPSERPM